MPIVMKYGDVAGESKIDGYTDWIDIDSMQFGVGRGISSAGQSSRRESSTVSVSEITVTKPQDNSSGKLFRQALDGDLDQEVKIVFLRTAQGAAPTPYFEVKLEDTGISGFSMSSGGDRPTESISLNFTKIEYKYYKVVDGLQAGDPDIHTYNLGTQVAG